MKIEHMFTETKRTRRGAMALLFGLAMMICALLLGLQSVTKPARAAGTTFTVNSTGDAPAAGPTNDGVCQTATAGECTLRAAIEEANGTAGADTIAFNIPGNGPHTIAPSSFLPVISQAVTIDGYTQGDATSDTADDATENTLTEPGKTNAVLKIQLIGGHAELFLNDGASKSVIRGLVIGFCLNSPCGSGISFSGGTGYKVEGNFLGIQADGTSNLGNIWGVLLRSGTSGSTIGGTTPDKRNLISGNVFDGVLVTDSSSGNKIEGNIIGPDKDGNPVGNGGSGVQLNFAGNGNRILSNSIFSNGTYTQLPSKLGIDLRGGTQDAYGHTDNDLDDPNTSKPDPDKDTGPNRLQNYPEITSAQVIHAPIIGTTASIHGTLESTPSTKKKKRTFIIQFFSSPEANPSGYGEGKKFLGQKQVTTNRQGEASFDFSPTTQAVSKGEFITATATNKKTGDTSEFSNAKVVEEPVIQPPGS